MQRWRASLLVLTQVRASMGVSFEGFEFTGNSRC